MSIKLQLPQLTDLRPRLTVIGVGGAGCNAINNMIAAGLGGVEFVVANTDAQALQASSAEHRIQLGASLTEGLGAGSKPEIGEAAAEEAMEEIRAHVLGSHMVFIAAGMGGGTGTGAAAVIARIAREAGILTVGVVTKPFQFEGARRMRIADAGINELRKRVDTLIVIPNQNLFRIANEKTTFAEAFVLADQVLYSGVACIVDLIVKEGLINLDFADVRTVMSGMGTAMMGTGEASGERRAIEAAEEAISNPLLDEVSLRGAKGLLLSITGGRDLTLYEVDEAASRVRQEVDADANIIVGATFDDSLGERVRVSIVASGMARTNEQPAPAQTSSWPRTPPLEPAYQAASRAEPVAPPVNVTAPTVSAHEPSYSWAPAPSQPAQPSAPQPADDYDVQRRLSEAIQYAPSGDAYGNSAGRGSEHEPDPRYAREEPRSESRAAWHAPGNVVIEDGLPQLTTAPRAPVPQLQAVNAPVPDFAPAPPADIRRPPSGARRMPEVEDFPVVGQREYRAKTASESVPPPASVEPRRRAGLFERLTGRGRHENDSPGAAGPMTSQTVTGRAGQQSSERPRISNHGPVDRSRSVAGKTQEDVELPVFFNRERK